MSRACLIGLQQDGQFRWQIEEQLDELEELAGDAGLTVYQRVIQRRRRPEPATYIGSGKAAAIAEQLAEDDLVLFDDELTPAQQGNLAHLMGVSVADRTQLILDIFAKRAHSKEGKIQVELAQLQYLLPRLTGHGTALSRLGGGIGTRGPGETKLETDRRRVYRRIADLKKQLDDVRRVRAQQRAGRNRHEVPLVALVGYTNSGKSSLMRQLTQCDIHVAQQMFATLDPAVRRWSLSDQTWVFLSDTVGFIRKLPAALVASFRATLEEVVHADLLLHVVDAAHPQMEEHRRAVEQVLQELEITAPVLNVYNKADLLDSTPAIDADDIAVSALTGHGCEALVQEVERRVAGKLDVAECFFSFAHMKQADAFRQSGQVLHEHFTEQGVWIQAAVRSGCDSVEGGRKSV